MTTPTSLIVDFTPPAHSTANIERQVRDVEDKLARAYNMDDVNQAEIQDLEFELEQLHNSLDASSMSFYR